MDLLQKLVNAIGPSGSESHVRQIIRNEIKPFVDDIKIDKMGNLICHKKGKGQKVMLAAHMDEIGLMVREIRTNGRIYFSLIGGIEAETLIAQQVIIMNGKNEFACKGVISYYEMHEGSTSDSLPKFDELYVDCGLTKKELLKMGIDVGCSMVPNNPFTILGNKKYVSGKALDNRVGCFVLLKLAEKLKNMKTIDLYYVFTVQEEFGLYGAKTSVYSIEPDWGIAVDTTSAEDSEEPYYTKLGAGVCVTMMDVELISNKCLNDQLFALGKKHNIPIQKKVEQFGTTDAAKLALSRGGLPATVVSVPLRNIHSTVTIAHLDDIKHAINLLFHMMNHPPKTCLV